MSSTTGDPAKWRPKRAAGEMDAGGDDASAEATGNRASPDASAEAVSSSVVYANLWLFIWLKTIGSYDSGAFSAVLGAANGIAETWDLSTVEQGTLTSSVFLGNIIGCPLAGHLFSSYNERQVLNISLIVHTVFTFLFATFPQYHIALLNRFFIGLSLAFVVVYTPVWVDAFAPKDRQSVWMASHNAGVPLGIMMGYLLGAFLPSYTNIGWEWAFYLKCVVMVPTIFYIAGVDPRTINARSRSTAVHPSSSAAPIISSQDGFVGRLRRRWMSVWCLIHPLLTNSIFMCSVLAMSSLYFVATGLQNFVTQYLREPPFNAPMKTIMAGFGVSVVTAPVCGVITGGILLDRFGGYQGNLRRVALFALCWGCAAAVFAVVCIFVSSTGVFLLVMSVVLFCGGAIIPPGAGLTMSSLPDHLRSVGAAFSQTFYNTLGNFSGPMVCGLVADWTGELKYGIMTLMLSSVLGIIPMVTILIIAMRMPRVSTDNTAATIVIMNAEDEDEDAESSGIDTSGPSRSSQAAATRNTVEMEELAQPPTITQAAQRRWVMEEEDVRRSASGVLGLRSANSAGEWVGGGSPGVPPMTSSVCFNTSFPPPSNAAPLTQIHRPRVAIGEGQPREVAEAADSPTVVCSPRPGAPSPNMASLEHKALRHSHRASVPPPSAAVLSRNSSIQLAVHDGESLQDLTMPTPHMFGMDVVHSWLLVQGKSEDFGSAASLPRGAMQAEDSLPRGAALTEEGSQRAPTAENDSRAEP